MTVRQLVICAAARGGRVYQIHYLNEDGNLGTGDIPLEAKKSEAEAVVKKFLADGMSADEVLEKVK